MLLSIIIGIAVIASIVIVVKTYFDDYSNDIGMAFLIGIFSFSMLLVLGFFIYAAFIFSNPNIEISYKQDIVSLNNQLTTEGSFTLGCGTLEGKEYYFYMHKLSDGGYKRGKVSVKNVILYETDEISPRIEWTEISNDIPEWYGPDIVGVMKKKDRKLYIPYGTIIKEFRVK